MISIMVPAEAAPFLRRWALKHEAARKQSGCFDHNHILCDYKGDAAVIANQITSEDRLPKIKSA